MILGVDIGTQGALALLTPEGGLVGVEDMPVLRDGPKAGRPSMGHSWRKSFIAGTRRKPSSSMLAPGPAKALWRHLPSAVPAGLWRACWRHAALAPACWKRAVGLSMASKDAARSEALRRWPSHAALFARVKDDGRAEAALIALAGLLKERRPAA